MLQRRETVPLATLVAGGQEVLMEFRPIGTIRSPFTELEGMPIQPPGASDIKGRVEILADFQEGLENLDGFSHIILLYHLHKSEGFDLRVVPFLDSTPRGLFSTRAPRRPNPIGLSVVRLERIEGRILYVEGIDIMDGTPLLDIKPHVPEFDAPAHSRTGWLEKAQDRAREERSDGRFSGGAPSG